MRHRVFGNRLSRPANSRKALFRELLRAIFAHNRLETTLDRAQAIQREIDRNINFLKAGTVSGRREVGKVLDKTLIAKLAGQMSDRFSKRNSGYSRIIRLGKRFSDGAQKVILELVDEEVVIPAEVKDTKEVIKKTTVKEQDTKKLTSKEPGKVKQQEKRSEKKGLKKSAKRTK